MVGRVEGKVAFITGAARGQGRSHALRLAQEGADIIALDLCADIDSIGRLYPGATESDLEETARQVKALGRGIVTHKADVRDFASIKAALDDGVSQFGHVDIVSANAGVFSFGEETHLVSEGDWDDVIDVNLKGVWQTCKAAIPFLIEQGTGGSMVLTSSAAALKGTPNIAAYSASKNGVIGLMRTLAVELAPHSVRVNTVNPITVGTTMIFNDSLFRWFMPGAERPTRDDVAPLFEGMNALPTPWVEPSDVSNAVVFLASDEARYVTGTELKIDAGYTIK